jgi:hypothetical protein
MSKLFVQIIVMLIAYEKSDPFQLKYGATLRWASVPKQDWTVPRNAYSSVWHWQCLANAKPSQIRAGRVELDLMFGGQ